MFSKLPASLSLQQSELFSEVWLIIRQDENLFLREDYVGYGLREIFEKINKLARPEFWI